ncbi:MAG: hydrogenase maturation nickel metallochaperone HypA [Magnetococcales bacterium]|nr:hydrogenase maturation nickel metallochaperone HypA [Magnetococcales bacterium]
MHEMSLAAALVEQVSAVLVREGAREVVSLTLALGPLCGVEREAFSFCFPLAAAGTPLAGATLHIRELPLTVRCTACGSMVHPQDGWDLACPTCATAPVEILQGRDFILETLEVR